MESTKGVFTPELRALALGSGFMFGSTLTLLNNVYLNTLADMNTINKHEQC